MLRHYQLIFIFLCLAFSLSGSASSPGKLLFTDNMLKKIGREHGAEVAKRFQEWKRFVQWAQNKPEQKKLIAVNKFFNQRLLWVSDIKLWKKKDYWATPIETLIRKAGDCEDFTIIKYFTLLAVDVPVQTLKLNYVKAIRYNQAHMVLSYAKTRRDMPLILDNINKKVLPANQRRDLKPVYSFNGQGLWIQNKNSGKKVGGSSRIRLWVDLNKRMQKERI